MEHPFEAFSLEQTDELEFYAGTNSNSTQQNHRDVAFSIIKISAAIRPRRTDSVEDRVRPAVLRFQTLEFDTSEECSSDHLA